MLINLYSFSVFQENYLHSLTLARTKLYFFKAIFLFLSVRLNKTAFFFIFNPLASLLGFCCIRD